MHMTKNVLERWTDLDVPTKDVVERTLDLDISNKPHEPPDSPHRRARQRIIAAWTTIADSSDSFAQWGGEMLESFMFDPVRLIFAGVCLGWTARDRFEEERRREGGQA